MGLGEIRLGEMGLGEMGQNQCSDSLVTLLRSGKLGGQRAGGITSGLLIQQRHWVFWRDVMRYCPAEKRKSRFQMLHECQEAASVSKRRRDSTI